MKKKSPYDDENKSIVCIFKKDIQSEKFINRKM